MAHWLIGREIVLVIQAGKGRAKYGKQVLEKLSKQLNERYGRGYSVPNLQNFRKFYQAFPSRLEIQYPVGTNLAHSLPSAKQYPSGTKLVSGFNPTLSWSHYRALMRVNNEEARDFYEQEAAECVWTKTQLERQILTAYYERIIDNHGQQGLISTHRERLAGEPLSAVQILKSPMVLEFLDLPDDPKLHESKLEQAIISNLQSFLLELGKGFSFIARQKNIRIDGDDFFIDLVFYNYILKCFLLIDLKLGKLTHCDVGQMDGYVRLFEDQFKEQPKTAR